MPTEPKFKVGARVVWERANDKPEGVILDGPHYSPKFAGANPQGHCYVVGFGCYFIDGKPHYREAKLLGEYVLVPIEQWVACPGPHREFNGKWQCRAS